MAGKPSPITPAVLTWALEEDGRSRIEIADDLGIDEERLDEWAHGESKPTIGEVTQLALKLKRPRAMFFLPAPPENSTIPPSFRHPPGDNRQVSPASRRRVRQARQVQTALSEVLANSGESQPNIQTFAPSVTSPEQAAAEVRATLDVSDQEQSSWSTDLDGMYAWRKAIEATGIFVFALEIGDPPPRGTKPRRATAGTPAPDVRGFSAWDDWAPMIVMNSRRVNPAARSFTMAHELGHLVTRSDAACLDTPIGPRFPEPTERWCEEFGAALLMPRGPVMNFARWRVIRPGAADLGDVNAMMRQFHTSARASALRLIELGLAEPGLYPAVEAAFQPKPLSEDPDKKRGGGDPRSVLRMRQFGPRAIDTVFSDLPPLEALSLLRMTVPDARALADEVPHAAVI